MALFWQILYYSFTALYVYAALVVLTVILLENRNPVKTLGWIMIMILFPIVGIVLYVFLGKNFRRKKIINNKLRFPDLNVSSRYSYEPERFAKVANLLTETNGVRVSDGNKVEVFTTGADAFKSLYNDIESAKEHIHVEFYIIENDKLGNRFRELLERKAREGVRVRIIYDYLGGWKLPIAWRMSLKEAGAFINPLLNYRNHRKLVVVDGRVAYTGGMNLAERYRIGNDLGLWRDTFVRVEGPAVHSMQYSFLVDWSFVDGKVVTDKKYYPEVSYFEDGESVQVVTSGPDSDWSSIMQGVVSAISKAEKEILIHTPYYMPPEAVTNALEAAALSGVRVRVMIPERNDSRIVAAAGRSYIEALLRAGVEVYYYRHNFLHSKAIVVDGYLSIVGTANMDTRSYEQNFEIAAFVYGEKTAKCLVEGFERDMESSRQLNVNLWHHRKWYKRCVESLARLISPLL